MLHLLLHHDFMFIFIDPEVLQNPFLYYSSYKEIYINCSVSGHPPLSILWLYSTHPSDGNYSVITANKVSIQCSHDINGSIVCNSSFRLYHLGTSSIGYYHCKVNTSDASTLSSPYHVKMSCTLHNNKLSH